MRKDIKKSSYYVWFLGAQESKGLRGAEYVVPVVKNLVQRERDVEPFKVTLQVSHKGLKIIQNIPPATAVGAAGGKSVKNAKPEVVKHFIPHHAVTCVLQDDDIVACILLLYNPVTKCPVHVHAYRCDSVETAEILRGQLQTLIERPENQKKLNEIEARLRAKGLLATPARDRDSGVSERGRGLPVVGGANPVPRRLTGGGSDGRSTSTRESESSGGSSSERLSAVGQQERIANLYDSLAAELREKLGAGGGGGGGGGRDKARAPHAPILLPPRDYDTVHRQKGNLTAIDLRRCLNANIVGVNVKGSAAAPGAGGSAARGSSGGSSGIGSDHAPSPDAQDVDADGPFLDHQSSSDEDWAEQPSEDSLFLVQPTGRPLSSSGGGGSGVGGGSGGGGGGWRGPGADLSLPRARRVHSSGSAGGGGGERVSERSGDGRGGTRHPLAAPTPPPAAATPAPADASPFRRAGRRQAEERQRQRSPSPSQRSGPLSPRDRFKDAKEKFLLLEKERLEEQRRQAQAQAQAQAQLAQQPSPQQAAPQTARTTNRSPVEPPISPAVQPHSGRRYRAGSWSRSRDSEDDVEERSRFFPPRSGHASLHHVEEPLDDEVYDDEEVFDYRLRSRSASNLVRRDSRGARLTALEDPIEEPRVVRRPRVDPAMYRRELDPERVDLRSEPRPAPRYPRRRYEEYSPERAVSPPPMRERVLSPARGPRPAPRVASHEEMRYARAYLEDIPLERYRSPARGGGGGGGGGPQPAPRHRGGVPDREPSPERRYAKRRTLFDALEEERRRTSHDLAREFKRRSYQDGGNGSVPDSYPGYQELPERERYPGLDRESARPGLHHAPSPAPANARSAGYRHSYAEGAIHHELLHRTGSSVSSGRVGIAAVHPY